MGITAPEEALQALADWHDRQAILECIVDCRSQGKLNVELGYRVVGFISKTPFGFAIGSRIDHCMSLLPGDLFSSAESIEIQRAASQTHTLHVFLHNGDVWLKEVEITDAGHG